MENCNSMHLTFRGGGGPELMLMTPQELERMPESGIEFEESVGPKESLLESVSESTSEVESTNDTESGTLATISISTDRNTDTTSIVINTKQGQQAFKINTTDLMQAAATLQPITLADLVKEETDGCTDHNHAPAKTKLTSLPSPECVQDEKNGLGIVCTHTGRCKMAWTCPECGKLFNKECKLKVHLRMHAGYRPFKCPVEGCDWTFTSVYKLNRHQESHSSAKEFKCDYEGCPRSFTTIYNLNSHKKIHIQPHSFTCGIDDCNMQFPTRRKMELHLRDHQGVEAPYKCTEESCGKKYYSANSMASHLRVHAKNRLQCPVDGCNKIFDRMSRFKTHVWQHRGEKPYVCTSENCTWAFSTASKLKRHMKKHTGDRQFKCNVCPKSFMRLEHLKGHEISHSGTKPFQCSHLDCGARFTARSSLYVHMKKHAENGEKMVHICPTCGKSYNCKPSLRVHLKKYHASDANALDGGITLIASDDIENQIMIPENLPDNGLVTVTVPSSEDDSVLLTETVAPEYLLATVIDEGSAVCSADPELGLIFSPDSNITSAQCSSNSSELMAPSPLESTTSVIHNDILWAHSRSGSARTDFCCKNMSDSTFKERSLLNLKVRRMDQIKTENIVASNDVVLTSTAFQPPHSSNILCLPNVLIPDDAPPTHGELYQDDGLLSTMAKELSVPVSLLTEQTNSHTEFTGTTINLQDLEYVII